jgi:RNA polymerase sigma-70 factor (ECF subfamily)
MPDDILPLIRGCLAQDRTSWNTLVKECTPVAVGILRRRYSSSSPDDHDDIIQIVFSRLVKNGLRNFHGTTKYEFIRYVEKTTVREAYSYRRQNLRADSNVSLDQVAEDEDGQESSLHNVLEDNRLRPDTIAEINDLYRRAMGQLSIKDQQIILYKIEGRTDTEIAELLDIPMGTVASRYNRAKELLQRTLIVAILIILSGRNLPWMTSL